jgi:TPR repeat protein
MASSSELETQIDELRVQGRMGEALPLFRECFDRHHMVPASYIFALRPSYHVDVSRLEQEAEAGSASSDFLLGWSYCRDSGGTRELAMKHLGRAAARGHALAMYYYVAHVSDAAAAFRWCLASAQLGCKMAMLALGSRFAHGYGTEQNFVQAGLWVARVAVLDSSRYQDDYLLFLRRHSHKCIPYGIWRPERIYQMLLPSEMRQAIFTWLLVAKRRRLARYAGLLVCSFSVTRSGW